MNSKDDANDESNEEGRNRAVVLRHDAKEAGLINRRVWLTPAEEPEFDRRIAPIGAHILGIAAALDHHGLRALKRCRAVMKPKGTTPTSGPTQEPKPADASQIKKAKPANLPAADAAPKPTDAPKPPKTKAKKPSEENPLFPDYKP